MSYTFIKYIDFNGKEKQVIERDDNYYLVDCTNMDFEEISWQKDGLTAVLITVSYTHLVQHCKSLIAMAI